MFVSIRVSVPDDLHKAVMCAFRVAIDPWSKTSDRQLLSLGFLWGQYDHYWGQVYCGKLPFAVVATLCLTLWPLD